MINILRTFALAYLAQCAILLSALITLVLLIYYGVVPAIFLFRSGSIGFPPVAEVLQTLKGTVVSAAVAAFVITVAAMLKKT